MSFPPLQNIPPESAKSTHAAPLKSTGFRAYRDLLEPGSEGNSSEGQPSGSPVSHARESVELVEEDGVVRKIRVRCKCGEVIELDCEYGAG